MSNKYSCSLFSVEKEDVSHEDEAVSRPLITRGVTRLQIHHRSTAGRVATVTSGRASHARPHRTWGLAGSGSRWRWHPPGVQVWAGGTVSPGMMLKTGEYLKDG